MSTETDSSFFFEILFLSFFFSNMNIDIDRHTSVAFSAVVKTVDL